MTSALKNAEKKAAQDRLYQCKAGKDGWQKLYRTTGSGVFLDEALKKEICLYGEAAQATYDTMDLQEWSRFRYGSRFYPAALLDPKRLLEESHFAELPEADYTADPGDQTAPGSTPLKGNGAPETKEEKVSQAEKGETLYVTYMHASEHSKIVMDELRNTPGQSIAADEKKHEEEKGVWIGYVAYSPKRQDILVAWRGTQQPAEWLADARLLQIPYTPLKPKGPFRLSTLLKLPSELWKVAKKVFYGVAAAGFTLFSTVAVPPLAILYELTSATTSGQERLGLWEKVKAFVAHALAVPVRCAVLGIVIFLMYWVEKAFPSTLDLLASLLTLALAFVASIPTVEILTPPWIGKPLEKVFAKMLGKSYGEDAYLPYKIYVGFVAVCSVWLHALPPHFLHGFWASPPGISLIVFGTSVILPLAWAAMIRAGAAAGEQEPTGGDQIRIHQGFHELYTHPEPMDNSPHSPKTTLCNRIRYLMEKHPVKTISVTGHSLGGALAVLSSFDLVKQGHNKNEKTGKYVPVTCYSFEGPRVGNIAFKEEYDRLRDQGLTAIRLVNKPDVVPAVPKAFFLQNVYYLLGGVFNKVNTICAAVDTVERVGHWLKFPTSFIHVGSEILVDSRNVKWLRKMEGSNPLSNYGLISPYHNLEASLHVLSGYSPLDAHGKSSGFGSRFTRDFALVNKTGNVLNPRFGISPKWMETMVKDVGFAGRVPPKGETRLSPVTVDEPAKTDPDTCAEKAQKYVRGYKHLEDAYKYEDAPKPATIQPYESTSPEPNQGPDLARVIGQGPQDETGRNQWLEEIHSWSDTKFKEKYGLKKEADSKGTVRSGNVVGDRKVVPEGGAKGHRD